MSSSDAAIKKVMTTLDRVHPLTWSMHSEVNDMEESEGLIMCNKRIQTIISISKPMVSMLEL